MERHRYDWDLTCPACGAKGHARVSEDAVPRGGKLNFSIDNVSEGFDVRAHGDNANAAVIVCAKCDVLV